METKNPNGLMSPEQVLQSALKVGPFLGNDEEAKAFDDGNATAEDKMVALYRSAMMVLPEEKWTVDAIADEIVRRFREGKQ